MRHTTAILAVTLAMVTVGATAEPIPRGEGQQTADLAGSKLMIFTYRPITGTWKQWEAQRSTLSPDLLDKLGLLPIVVEHGVTQKNRQFCYPSASGVTHGPETDHQGG